MVVQQPVQYLCVTFSVCRFAGEILLAGLLKGQFSASKFPSRL